VTAWRRAFGELRRGNLRLSDLHRSRLAVGAYGALRRGLDRAGVQVVAKSFYSPIPDLRQVPDSVWERRSDLAGIAFDAGRQLRFIEQNLKPFVDEFHGPGPDDAPPYSFENGSYGRMDAETLYSVVRFVQPQRIIELGSGHSTLVLGRAALVNAAAGRRPELMVFDPYPGVAGPDTGGVTTFEPAAAQDVPADVIGGLAENDVLVVDTTHTVKLGGDVNRIVLDLLPRLKPGVYVHFHDIFLPWEYPRVWLERYGLYWTEQYLVQAFLACNPRFEIVCALYALAREHPERLSRVYPSWTPGVRPGAFWIRSQ
jgi:Methyltransferase domain